MNFRQLLKNWFAVALGVWIASGTVSSIHYDTIEALIIAVLLLGFFNSFLKPLLMFFSLPFIVFTFGIGIWIINAALLLLAARLVNGFYVENFISALWGALIISIIKGIMLLFLNEPNSGRSVKIRVGRTSWSSDKRPKISGKDATRRSKLFTSEDDVIDI